MKSAEQQSWQLQIPFPNRNIKKQPDVVYVKFTL